MDKRTQKLIFQGVGVAVGGFLFAKFLKQPISGILDSVGA